MCLRQKKNGRKGGRSSSFIFKKRKSPGEKGGGKTAVRFQNGSKKGRRQSERRHSLFQGGVPDSNSSGGIGGVGKANYKGRGVSSVGTEGGEKKGL